jgi:hypothetical protein
LKYDRNLFELGALSRLDPSGRALHMGDADRLGAGVDLPDELFDDLRLAPRGVYPRRGADVYGIRLSQ